MATDIELLSQKAGRQAALAEAGMAAVPPEETMKGRIEWTIFTPYLSLEDLESLCCRVLEKEIAGLFLPLPYVPQALSFTESGNVKVSPSITSPSGTDSEASVCAEILAAREAGAGGVLAALPVHRLKAGDKAGVRFVLEKIRDAAGPLVLSVSIETGLMDDEEIIAAVRCAEIARADRVIGSSGFWGFSTIRETALLRCAAPDWMKVGVTVEHPVEDWKSIFPFFAAGADFIVSSVPGFPGFKGFS